MMFEFFSFEEVINNNSLPHYLLFFGVSLHAYYLKDVIRRVTEDKIFDLLIKPLQKYMHYLFSAFRNSFVYSIKIFSHILQRKTTAKMLLNSMAGRLIYCLSHILQYVVKRFIYLLSRLLKLLFNVVKLLN